ncbi:MAG TPA: hypothetical protein VG815_16845 [Chloroflexota bacterium]|jgi:hypothetical protein|nr:hypothetical protein [Chloroflexota bacterium]
MKSAKSSLGARPATRATRRRLPGRGLLTLLLFGGIALTASGEHRTVSAHHPASTRCGVWRVTPTPVPATPSGVLKAVAAISRRDVWAVGSNGLGSALVEHWNGTGWRIIRAPSPAGSALLGIKALSADDIWAVGRRSLTNGDSATQRPLIEHWNVPRRAVESDSADGERPGQYCQPPPSPGRYFH